MPCARPELLAGEGTTTALRPELTESFGGAKNSVASIDVDRRVLGMGDRDLLARRGPDPFAGGDDICPLVRCQAKPEPPPSAIA